MLAKGENKRLLELSVAEAGPSFVSAGLVNNEQLKETVAEMQRLGDDETVLAVMPRMSQVWGEKTTALVRVRRNAVYSLTRPKR